MTATTGPTEPAEVHPALDAPAQPGPDEDQDHDQDADGSAADEDQADDTRPARQAARYRAQLRTVEAERDELRTTVDGLQRQIVDGLVAARGYRPAALWATVSGTADLLDPDSGAVSEHRLDEALVTAEREFGLKRAARPPQWHPGFGSEPVTSPPTWGDVLRR